MARPTIYRLFLRTCCVLIVGYLLTVTLIVCFQERLLFSPASEGPRTPLDFNVPYTPITLSMPATGTVSSTNSIPVHGWFVHSTTPKPIVVYCHGNGGNLSARAHVAALFASVGLDAVMVAAPGYGMSGFGVTPTSEKGFYEAADAAYQFARARVPGSQILVWGHSMGAAVAAHLATTRAVAGLLLESPFTTISDMVPVRYPWLLVPQSFIRHPFPTIDYVRRYRGPLLVMAAQQDTIVPPRMGRAVFDAANEPKRFLPLTGINHNELPEHFGRFKPVIQQFVAETLTHNDRSS